MIIIEYGDDSTQKEAIGTFLIEFESGGLTFNIIDEEDILNYNPRRILQFKIKFTNDEPDFKYCIFCNTRLIYSINFEFEEIGDTSPQRRIASYQKIFLELFDTTSYIVNNCFPLWNDRNINKSIIDTLPVIISLDYRLELINRLRYDVNNNYFIIRFDKINNAMYICPLKFNRI